MKKSALAILLVILAVICCLIITGCGCGAADTDSDDDSGNYEIVKDLTQKNYTDYLTVKGKINGKGNTFSKTYTNPSISIIVSSTSEDYIFSEAKIKATITYVLYKWDGYAFDSTRTKTETVDITLDKNGNASVTVDSLRASYGTTLAYAYISGVSVDSASGKVYVPCLHKWKDVKTVTAPTCTEAGLKAVICEKCQKTQETAVDALGHNIVEEEGLVTLQPTCIANGTKTYTCKTCKGTVEETLPSVEHTYDNGTASVEATCTTNGILVYTCLTCQGTKEEEIVATGHSYDEENAIIIEATCTTGGKVDYICTKCNTHTSETSDPLGHSFTTYTSVDATCTADAYEYAKCDNCEEIDTKVTEGTALGHSYDENGRCTTCSTINPDLKVTSLEISNESFLVEVDEEVQITFNVYPSNAQYDNVTYTIYQNNTCEAILTEDGKLTCGKVGSVTIAVTIDGEITARATFYVPQSISTAEEFYNIRNDLSGVYMLANDIDLSSYEKWTPIGNATKTNGNYDYTNAFSGKLDGNNFTISGINLDLSDDTCNSLLTVGLFGSLSRDGQISNLNIKNVNITGSSSTTDYVGMLTGFNPGSIENCTVDGTINISSVTYVGGAIGENIGSAQDIEATATIYANNNSNDEILVGGVVGRSTGGQISDVKATGDISVSSSCVSYVGGIAGNLLDKLTGASADVNITLNHSSSYSSDSHNYVGIIAGSSAKGFSDTTVDGSITVSSYLPVYVGGVVGYVEDDITDCTNNATISLSVYSSNSSHLGGIAGYSSKNITNCKNTGTISVPKYSGGYVGGIAGEAGVISSCDNEAEITITQSYYRYYYYDYSYSTYTDYSSTAYVGGVAGKAASVSSSNNNSKIAVKIYSESSNYIGGVVGYSGGAVSSSTNKEAGELVISDAYSSSSYQSQYFGGVVGCVNDSVLESENYGKISASSQATTYCGGIAGSVANSVSNAENHADVKVTTNSTLYCGGVAGYVTGSVSDATNNNEITAKSTESSVYCGGVVGHVVDVISNATNYADISAIAEDDLYCGGVAGKNDGTATNVKNLSYDLNAKSMSSSYYTYPNAYVGGVLGYSSGDVTTASNTAKITVDSEQLYVGGVVGYAESVTVSQAYNSANIDVYGDYYDGYSYIGGVVGSASTVEKSYSTSSKITVAASSNVYVGGVVGKATDSISLCYSYPNITVSNSRISYVGGVSGYTPKITKSYSTSNLICNTTNYESLYIGGLSGCVSTLAEECYASSDVSGTSSSEVYMGGLIGYTSYDSNIKNCYAANGYIKTNSSSISSSSETYLYNGGLIGYNNGTIDSCYSVSYGYSASYGSANSHTHYIGGLVAYNNGNISKSYVLDAFDKLARTGLETNRDVVGSGAAKAFYAGGFVGYNEGGIENCYTYATVNTSVSGAFTGGFVGCNASTISKAIAYGEVNSGIAGDTTGGFAGGGAAGYSDCLFSTESSKLSTAIGNKDSDKITASTNASLRTPDTFTSFSTDIWNIVEGTYPQIKFGTVWENRTDGFNKYDMLLNVPNQEYQYQFPHSNRITIKFESEIENDWLEDITTNIGSTIVLPTLGDAVIDGVQYIFVGWCSDEERLELLSSNIIESVDTSKTYYAYYCQAIDKPTTETFVYSGEEISVSDIFVNTDMYTITGDFTATNAGTYTLTFELAHGYCWADGSLDYSLEWTITPCIVSAPVIYDNGQYIFYTGTERDLSEEFASDIYTLTGDVSITEIDDSLHTITISLNDTQNYVWADETTDDKSYEYYIVTGVCGYNSVYKISDGVLTISGSGGIDNYNSTTAPWYENREEITSIVFSEEITSIGSYAFEGFTALTEITIPDKVISIVSNAFSGCSGLTSITIPDNVGTIGSGAFSGCTSLESITLPFVGYSASSSSSSALLGYIFGSSSYEGGVETTQRYYYYGSSTATYYIPASLKNVTVTGGTIAYGAFSGCSNLESITISDDITSVGEYAFYNCSSLTSIELSDNLTSVLGYTFSGCSALTSITVPDSVESISSGAFSGCASLESITLPFVGYSASSSSSNALLGYIFGSSSYEGGVETTQNYYHSSYYGSSTTTYYIPASLKNVTITGGIIAYGAFSGCSSIEAITLGDDITSVGSYAFSNCSSLTSIELPDNLTSISEYAFFGCSALESIVIPDNVETINGSVFYDCTSLKDVKISDSVTYIGSYVFYNCSSLESIELPSGLTNIASRVFSGCSALKSVDIPDSVTYIDSYAFSGCSSLESIEISDSVTTIYGSAFENCTALAEITIGVGVSSISASAFTGCTSLSTITVDSANESYKDVDGNLYSKDGTTFILYAKGKDDTTLDIPDGVTIINGNALSDCTLLESITVPSGVTSIYSSTFSGCTGLKSITLPSGLTSIGSSAFNGCSSLTSITLPSGLTSIDSSAFNGCSGITSIVIPDTVTSIGSGAFSGCSALESITLPFVGNTASSSSNYALFGYIFGSSSYDGGVETTQNYYHSYYGSRTTTYYIPSSLKNVTVTGGSINYGAFSGCSGIESITIGENVTSIGNYAFYNCTALKELNYNATTVYNLSSGNYAFYCTGQNTDGLTVTIGNNVTKIPAYLFCPYNSNSSYAPKITNVVFEDDSKCESIGEYAFGCCSSLSSIEIPKNITTIYESAFTNCTGLTEINFNATTMNDLSSNNYAFHNAGKNGNGITVTIGNNVTKIPAYLFCHYNSNSSYAPKITNVVFEDDSACASIGNYAFHYCSALEQITIPDSIASIGSYAFCYCSALEQITIPDSVTSIGNRTFGYCSYLTIYCEVESAPNSWASDWNCSSCPVIWAIKDSGATEDGFIWAQTVNDEIIIANYIGNNVILTIPDTINSLPVTSIAANAFYNYSSLISVTIPRTITSIGNNAFSNCYKLVEVYDLTGLGITAGSSSYGNVGYYAKAVHTSLDDASILEVVDDFVFMTYDSTYYLVGYVGDDTEIALPESYKEYSYTIYKYAFSGSSITGITVPETVTSIDSNAFNGCTNLTSATIPASLISSMPNRTTLQNVVITGNGSIPSQAFYGCSSLKSVIIGDEITSIGSNAFYNCYSLTSIEIPEEITSIGSSAFYGCTNLTEIKFNATAMNDLSTYNSVFYNAGTSGTGITVTIGKNVTKIPAYLFNPYEGSYVPRITSVVFEEDSVCESIGNYAFYYSTSLQSINIPDSVTCIGAYAFYNCSLLESIDIPESVTSIGTNAFYNCSSLQSITIPENITIIGNYAFRGCTALTEINFNATDMNDLSSNNYIFYNAGYYSEGITVTIGNNVTKIPDYLFCPYSSSSSYAPRITSVVFEEESACESIGNYAFYNCSSLLSIELPQSVTSIGNSAFYNCSSLQSITIPENITIIGNYAFRGCTALTEINFNATDMNDLSSNNYIFYNAGYYSEGITVTIGENVTKIPDYLFNPYEGSYDPYITSVVFEGESDCESIGSYAFYDADSLSSIVIPDSVTVIESYAFSNCSYLTIYCKAASQPTDWYYDWNSSGCTVYWYSESEPTSSGNYWHYDTDGNIAVW